MAATRRTAAATTPATAHAAGVRVAAGQYVAGWDDPVGSWDDPGSAWGDPDTTPSGGATATAIRPTVKGTTL